MERSEIYSENLAKFEAEVKRFYIIFMLVVVSLGIVVIIARYLCEKCSLILKKLDNWW